jgi:oligosaccharyltransferase complex subunit beta
VLTSRFDKSGNEDFCNSLVEWAFHERSVLRVKSVSHHRPGQTEVPSVYTIKEEVEYEIEIEEWNGKKWAPYTGSDVQLEFIMLDPYVRTSLKPSNGKLTTIFQIPDVYGFFTFKVEYLRKGISRLESIERVPVRPFRHTEYERFIDAAYPYYASATSMLVGLFVFSWVFLYYREK